MSVQITPETTVSQKLSIIAEQIQFNMKKKNLHFEVTKIDKVETMHFRVPFAENTDALLSNQRYWEHVFQQIISEERLRKRLLVNIISVVPVVNRDPNTISRSQFQNLKSSDPILICLKDARGGYLDLRISKTQGLEHGSNLKVHVIFPDATASFLDDEYAIQNCFGTFSVFDEPNDQNSMVMGIPAWWFLGMDICIIP